ncbi:uncharacterized protein K02A2.6-like [Eupeodes corollae]|uniref:uncharacterized protein K02A2.6-like n=1 Tax=Eupeodes corollae TaxID=290404 RepID=UPI00249049B7|nr:uncharacterized protein K02A2.6-like [Eupeodes corollae]
MASKFYFREIWSYTLFCFHRQYLNLKMSSEIWTGESTLDLITFFEMHPNLYNPCHKDYIDRVKRCDSLQSIVDSLLPTMSNVNIELIKRKIHTLKNQFSREFREIQKSKKSGAGLEDILEPKLWCFDQLLFLKTFCQTKTSVSNIQQSHELESSTSQHCETPEPDDNESPKGNAKKRYKMQSSISKEIAAVTGLLQKKVQQKSQYAWLGKQVVFEMDRIQDEQDGIIGFPIFDPDHSRVDIIKWCSDIDTRIERDNLKDFDVLHRVRSSLMGRSKAWFDKYGYQHYSWSDLRSSIIHAFSSGTDIVAQLRKVATSESKEFGSYSDFVMEKVSQINRLPFEVPEDKIVKIIIGCITNLGLKNSLMFVMPTSIQCLIDHLSSISEPPRRQQDASVLNDGNTKRLFKTKPSDEDNFGFQNKRPRLETEKKCFKCGKVGHLKANCPRLSSGNRFKHERLENVKICSYCNKAGHEERTCWSKQNADQRKVNLCNDVLMAENTTDVFINGRLYHCVLDTGSDCSLLRADIANQMSLKRVAHFLSIQGISKHPILLTEKVTLLIEFEKLNTEITFYIIEEIYLKNEIIIGRDVLSDSSLEIRVDMHGSTLQRKDHLISSSNVLTKKICEATPDQNFQVESLLNKYSASIVKGFPVTEVQTGSLNIRLNQEVVVNYRPYRMAFSERTVVSQIISELKSQNIVRDSSSPFASPIVLVKKKNGQHRLRVDYRALNRATVKDRYPLPRIEDQLDRLSGNKYFTSLDMASGFHQIPIEESSIEKTAFVTPDGHFEYLRMPFGLANAPAVFQRAINKALGTLMDKTALVYMDDVLIPSSTVEEGIKNLDLVLKALTQSGFSLNIEKCKFLKTEIEYLGREVSVEGIRPGKSKIEVLVKSIPPANVKQV